ncbi:unnamed protein product [Prorocentrum cordatum]|uniref:Phospholipase/carboxylesterase/thioesterase domain-containing protein n=1 Tax=Prorocentrum cordatum TaxID=2364126 RepID=A0ABN9UQ17_9DINO|nr:unnamed protein product [Polarella glacialis]
MGKPAVRGAARAPGRRVLGSQAARPRRQCPAPLRRRAAALLPALHRHTRGRPFGPRAWRAWLRLRLGVAAAELPSEEEALRLLRGLARTGRPSGRSKVAAAAVAEHAGIATAAWRSSGTRYIDPESTADVSNIRGFACGRISDSSRRVSWHEYGTLYRVSRAAAASKGKEAFKVTSTSCFKRVGCSVIRKNLPVMVGGSKTEFKGSVVFEPCRHGLKLEPEWTLIYLHSFSCKGSDYLHFPNYFGIGDAAVRVVVPTAPLLEQSCFKDWNVWRGERIGWRPIQFRAWFDYLTDRAGSAENDLELGSLLEMRARLHALIQQEAARHGGDSRRVILGGASQGCCVALDAAMTYPGELGGVVGLVGHLLGCTPLDMSKRAMPIHLFHEATDKEMRWSWVKGTVQRLIDAGFDVTSRREKEGTGSGHWIQDIEGRWIRAALRRITLGA